MGAFVARLCLGLLATLVATNCFEGCIGDPLGGIDDIGRIAKVEHELLRVGEVAFDLLPEARCSAWLWFSGERRDRDADKIDAVLGDLHDAACREPNHDSPLAQQIHSLEDWCREP